jgi:hypothetical protein
MTGSKLVLLSSQNKKNSSGKTNTNYFSPLRKSRLLSMTCSLAHPGLFTFFQTNMEIKFNEKGAWQAYFPSRRGQGQSSGLKQELRAEF